MSSPLKIAVIVGSTRPGRIGAGVAAWVLDQAHERSGTATYELVDLTDFDLDLLDDPVIPGAAKRNYVNPKTRVWSERIDSYDGYVFVTPEYNHGVPAALKNAVDVLYPEWGNKAASLVSYGADAGVRAVEQWRQILANLFVHVTRGQVSFSTFTEFGDAGFAPHDHRAPALHSTLDQLEALAQAVRVLRT